MNTVSAQYTVLYTSDIALAAAVVPWLSKASSFGGHTLTDSDTTDFKGTVDPRSRSYTTSAVGFRLSLILRCRSPAIWKRIALSERDAVAQLHVMQLRQTEGGEVWQGRKANIAI